MSVPQIIAYNTLWKSTMGSLLCCCCCLAFRGVWLSVTPWTVTL